MEISRGKTVIVKDRPRQPYAGWIGKVAKVDNELGIAMVMFEPDTSFSVGTTVAPSDRVWFEQEELEVYQYGNSK